MPTEVPNYHLKYLKYKNKYNSKQKIFIGGSLCKQCNNCNNCNQCNNCNNCNQSNNCNSCGNNNYKILEKT